MLEAAKLQLCESIGSFLNDLSRKKRYLRLRVVPPFPSPEAARHFIQRTTYPISIVRQIPKPPHPGAQVGLALCRNGDQNSLYLYPYDLAHPLPPENDSYPEEGIEQLRNHLLLSSDSGATTTFSLKGGGDPWSALKRAATLDLPSTRFEILESGNRQTYEVGAWSASIREEARRRRLRLCTLVFHTTSFGMKLRVRWSYDCSAAAVAQPLPNPLLHNSPWARGSHLVWDLCRFLTTSGPSVRFGCWATSQLPAAEDAVAAAIRQACALVEGKVGLALATLGALPLALRAEECGYDSDFYDSDFYPSPPSPSSPPPPPTNHVLRFAQEWRLHRERLYVVVHACLLPEFSSTPSPAPPPPAAGLPEFVRLQRQARSQRWGPGADFREEEEGVRVEEGVEGFVEGEGRKGEKEEREEGVEEKKGEKMERRRRGTRRARVRLGEAVARPEPKFQVDARACHDALSLRWLVQQWWVKAERKEGEVVVFELLHAKSLEPQTLQAWLSPLWPSHRLEQRAEPRLNAKSGHSSSSCTTLREDLRLPRVPFDEVWVVPSAAQRLGVVVWPFTPTATIKTCYSYERYRWGPFENTYRCRVDGAEEGILKSFGCRVVREEGKERREEEGGGGGKGGRSRPTSKEHVVYIHSLERTPLRCPPQWAEYRLAGELRGNTIYELVEELFSQLGRGPDVKPFPPTLLLLQTENEFLACLDRQLQRLQDSGRVLSATRLVGKEPAFVAQGHLVVSIHCKEPLRGCLQWGGAWEVVGEEESLAYYVECVKESRTRLLPSRFCVSARSKRACEALLERVREEAEVWWQRSGGRVQPFPELTAAGWTELERGGFAVVTLPGGAAGGRGEAWGGEKKEKS